MKKTYKNKKFDSFPLYVTLIAVCAIFLTIGFSACQDILNIGDAVAVVRVQKDIRITGVSLSSTVSSASSSYEEYYSNNILK